MSRKKRNIKSEIEELYGADGVADGGGDGSGFDDRPTGSDDADGTDGESNDTGNGTENDNPVAARPTVKEWLGRVFGWINGPYRALAIVLLALLLVLFGRDVLESLRVRGEIRELRRRKTELERSIREDSTLLRSLDDPEFLEKFAREKFLMRREGEEVYILK